MVLHVTRKFDVVEIVYEGDEEVSFVLEKPSGKIEIYLPYDNTATETGVYSVYGAYKSGYSFTSETMVHKRKGKQFVAFKPAEKGEHTIKVLGTQEETKIII
jgi:hypothetical protein